MKIRTYFFAAFFFLAFGLTSQAEALPVHQSGISAELGGGGGKDKKEKKEKADKGEDKEKKKKLYNPQRGARKSASDARRAMRTKEKSIMGRAKVRNFFHNMFNSKYGKTVNFRKKRARRRWKKGR